MKMEIHLNSSLILLKYVNCIERVLFVDNKWMKDYEDISNSVDREYKGVPLYLKKVLETFKKHNVQLFLNLPPKDDIRIFDGELECVVLESIRPSKYIPEEEKEKSLIVVACPLIERVFHFKAVCNENIELHKGILKRFFYHPQLSRIKILSRNFIESSDKVNLKSLQFLFFLPSDAEMVNKTIKEVGGRYYLDNLVPDPAVGVSIGSLSNYFVMPIKVEKILRDEDNLHQVILNCTDWNGKSYPFHITVKLFKDTFKAYPDEFQTPFYIRALVFQEFCESFRSVINLEKISEEEFIEDSFVAFINFRKRVIRSEIPHMPAQIPDRIFTKNDTFIYKPNGFQADDMESLPDYFSKKLVYPTTLKKFQRYFKFHPEIRFVEQDKSTSFLIPIILSKHNPTGLHKNILKESPLERLKFYCLHKRVIIFCTNCKKYKAELEIKDCPNECPNCGAGTLTELTSLSDEKLFSVKLFDEKYGKKKDRYEKIALLFLYNRKPTLYVLAAGIFSFSRAQEILHRLGKIQNVDIFFEKLLKVKEECLKKRDLLTILYKI